MSQLKDEIESINANFKVNDPTWTLKQPDISHELTPPDNLNELMEGTRIADRIAKQLRCNRSEVVAKLESMIEELAALKKSIANSRIL